MLQVFFHILTNSFFLGSANSPVSPSSPLDVFSFVPVTVSVAAVKEATRTVRPFPNPKGVDILQAVTSLFALSLSGNHGSFRLCTFSYSGSKFVIYIKNKFQIVINTTNTDIKNASCSTNPTC